MERISSISELQKKREQLKSNLKLRESANNVEDLIQIKVSMGTCGIASGAKQVMDTLIDLCDKHNIEAVITQVDCLGYCDSEPTVMVQKPQASPIIFGNVIPEKAEELVSEYIINNKLLDNIIESNN